ncbi:malonic semialdehyde reductase [Parvularcula lutaonensis]|uniref:Putative NADH dehydrogenase/NAD(P)H nitroreductase ACFONP_04565 n=1 Tax=Parvularcula lutaonensis TaxID=491923 RepID=A0ABV7MBC8_9PROT|nr:malonic semialdehyde reductase [Parvularcula lutaonensis]GGY46640.1 putative NADH dehydrogenase/NAD(P)H nitroreductase [Parvularcula lutaonensis]
MDRTIPISAEAQAQIFTEARTRNAWSDRKVTDEQVRQIYDLMKWGPTSANCQPARFLFLRTEEAKKKLEPFLMEGNREKTMAAPLVCIIGYDLAFYERLPELFPHTDAKSWFEGNDDLIRETAFRNGTLQGAYLMIAARALGLDCGPMSGFDQDGVNEAFFAGTTVKANWICNIGYGTDENLFERSPRLPFDEAAELL